MAGDARGVIMSAVEAEYKGVNNSKMITSAEKYCRINNAQNVLA